MPQRSLFFASKCAQPANMNRYFQTLPTYIQLQIRMAGVSILEWRAWPPVRLTYCMTPLRVADALRCFATVSDSKERPVAPNREISVLRSSLWKYEGSEFDGMWRRPLTTCAGCISNMWTKSRHCPSPFFCWRRLWNVNKHFLVCRHFTTTGAPCVLFSGKGN